MPRILICSKDEKLGEAIRNSAAGYDGYMESYQ